MTMPSYQALQQELRPGQLLELLLSSIPEVCFFIKDRDYRFVTANPALVKILGARSLAEVVGKTDLDFTADFLAEAFQRDDQRVLELGESIVDQVELVPTPATLEWRCTTKIPLYNTKNCILALAGITRRLNDSDSAYAEHPEMHVIVDFIQANYAAGITKLEMAAAAGISVSTLERLFRKTFGIPPGQYVRKMRLNAACQLIRESDEALADIATRCGFFDQTSMTHLFRSELKITPNRYRQRFSQALVNT